MGRVVGYGQSFASSQMRRVVWTDYALDELVSIHDYIADFNPAAARRFVIKLRAAGESLNQYSEHGRLGTNGVRELVIVRPYVIRYRVHRDRVEILDVRHSARRPL